MKRTLTLVLCVACIVALSSCALLEKVGIGGAEDVVEEVAE